MHTYVTVPWTSSITLDNGKPKQSLLILSGHDQLCCSLYAWQPERFHQFWTSRIPNKQTNGGQLYVLYDDSVVSPYILPTGLFVEGPPVLVLTLNYAICWRNRLLSRVPSTQTWSFSPFQKGHACQPWQIRESLLHVCFLSYLWIYICWKCTNKRKSSFNVWMDYWDDKPNEGIPHISCHLYGSIR